MTATAGTDEVGSLLAGRTLRMNVTTVSVACTLKALYISVAADVLTVEGDINTNAMAATLADGDNGRMLGAHHGGQAAHNLRAYGSVMHPVDTGRAVRSNNGGGAIHLHARSCVFGNAAVIASDALFTSQYDGLGESLSPSSRSVLHVVPSVDLTAAEPHTPLRLWR